MAVKNHNFRFNEEKEAERQAWEILHSKEVKEDFRSQNEFVIAAINDYYTRHLATKQGHIWNQGKGRCVCKRHCGGGGEKGT